MPDPISSRVPSLEPAPEPLAAEPPKPDALTAPAAPKPDAPPSTPGDTFASSESVERTPIQVPSARPDIRSEIMSRASQLGISMMDLANRLGTSVRELVNRLAQTYQGRKTTNAEENRALVAQVLKEVAEGAKKEPIQNAEPAKESPTAESTELRVLNKTIEKLLASPQLTDVEKRSALEEMLKEASGTEGGKKKAIRQALSRLRSDHLARTKA